MEFRTEAEVHDYFHGVMKADFYMAHECVGVCQVNHPLLGTKDVIADFLLYPKPHLLELGFADTWFAVEIKKPNSNPDNAYRQAFWYTASNFAIKERIITPAFSAVYIPGFNPEQYYGPNATDNEKTAQCIQNTIARTFARMNVSAIRLDVPHYVDWIIYFGADAYAKRYAKTNKMYLEGKYAVSKSRKSFKFLIGNCKSKSNHSGMLGTPMTKED